jgi:hypothetical protein
MPEQLTGVSDQEGENMKWMSIEELLEKPYWIVDILPEQVKQDSPGQYFAVEKYFLTGSRLAEIKRKHIRLILKLNCYMDISLDDETAINPPPQRIAEVMQSRYVNIRIGDALIISEADDTHLSVFNAGDALMERIQILAAAEGLFVWRP